MRRLLRAFVGLASREGRLDPPAERLQRAVAGAFAAAGPAGSRAKDVLNGTSFGHPLHPALTDVPTGAWTVALVLDAAGSKAADAAIAIGLAGAAGAAVTGLADWQYTQGAARRVGVVHASLNGSAVVLYALSLLARALGARAGGKLSACLGYACMTGASYLGGYLVSGEQIGVDRTAVLTLPGSFVPVLAADDLQDGKPRKVLAEGTPVVLVREGSDIHALVETCSHLGGPLSEGQVEEGAIVCPWHGSRFSLSDGEVINGPSAFRQPCLEVRVHDGQIEVRRAASSPV